MICKDHWTAVALSRNLKSDPMQVVHDGVPVVLFRAGDKVQALDDLCPHRLAELSKGRVMSGQIECPYHGWRFDGAGLCTAIPGHLDETPRYKVRAHSVIEKAGAIFLSSGAPDADPYIHSAQDMEGVTRVVESDTRSTLIDVAENILDATHTHYTHKGLLRGLSSDRHKVNVRVTGGPGWVEACYTGEDRQHGFISRLLEGERTKTIGRFLYPGIAELEYWGPDGLVLVTSFHLRQSAEDRVRGIGWLFGPGTGPIAHLKALAFKPLFNVALRQDQRVLASAFDNAARHDTRKIVVGPLDFLRTEIETILQGKVPGVARSPRDFVIEL